MKKYIISLMVLSIMGQIYPLNKEESQLRADHLTLVANVLKESSEKMLGGPSKVMFESKKYPIDPNGLEAWVYTVNGLKGLINQYNVKQNPIWNDYFNALVSVNHDLLTAIKIAYSHIFSPMGDMDMRLENGAVIIAQFQSLIKRINKIIKPVMNYKGSLKYVKEAMICDMIVQYGYRLRTMTSSAIFGMKFAR